MRLKIDEHLGVRVSILAQAAEETKLCADMGKYP